MSVGVELFHFSKTEASDDIVNFRGVAETGVVDTALGNEFDFYYKQDFLSGFEFSMHTSVFVPNNSSLPITEDIIQVTLQTAWQF